MNNTILVIDDCSELRENISEILTLSNYNVLLAKNGKEGLEILRKNHPDLILCDIMMPDLDGYGVLHALQNDLDLSAIPFVFITGQHEPGSFRKAMDNGADDFLEKPFSGDTLLKIISARITKSNALKKAFTNDLNGLTNFITETKLFHDMNAFSEKQNIKKYKKKEFVFSEGDAVAEHIYYIVKGKIKVFKTNYWGKEYITEIYKEGDFFGYLSVFNNAERKDSAVAIDDSQLLLISKQDFFRLLHSNQEVSSAFIKILAGNLTEAGEKLMRLAYDSARKKVSEALLYISKKYEDKEHHELSFPILRENISAIAGLSPESVSRNLTDFRHEGLINIVNGTIKILDLKKLENMKW
jgi:CRP-like cAMP-binding protein/FixJ family two-component response regulator